MGLTIEQIRVEGERLMEALALEGYRAHAGLKSEADFQSIYRVHQAILSRESLELAMAEFRQAPAGSEEARRARLLLDWQVEVQAGRAVADIDEREISWE